eukprot:TRINITY_DN4735_c0_g1_i1.p3 TRINITY_DN4735_c0_g1~~TRINITY_DN4735_c0_g1_i1.p3  ORF type:complete len:111 (-),score=18.93 TRINITY_DN4735_c0_g1_i1:375-707(-)
MLDEKGITEQQLAQRLHWAMTRCRYDPGLVSLYFEAGDNVGDRVRFLLPVSVADSFEPDVPPDVVTLLEYNAGKYTIASIRSVASCVLGARVCGPLGPDWLRPSDRPPPS